MHVEDEMSVLSVEFTIVIGLLVNSADELSHIASYKLRCTSTRNECLRFLGGSADEKLRRCPGQKRPEYVQATGQAVGVVDQWANDIVKTCVSRRESRHDLISKEIGLI